MKSVKQIIFSYFTELRRPKTPHIWKNVYPTLIATLISMSKVNAMSTITNIPTIAHLVTCQSVYIIKQDVLRNHWTLAPRGAIQAQLDKF